MVHLKSVWESICGPFGFVLGYILVYLGSILGSILRPLLSVNDEARTNLLLTWNGKRAFIYRVSSCILPFFVASCRLLSLLRAERAGRAGRLAGKRNCKYSCVCVRVFACVHCVRGIPCVFVSVCVSLCVCVFVCVCV